MGMANFSDEAYSSRRLERREPTVTPPGSETYAYTDSSLLEPDDGGSRAREAEHKALVLAEFEAWQAFLIALYADGDVTREDAACSVADNSTPARTFLSLCWKWNMGRATLSEVMEASARIAMSEETALLFAVWQEAVLRLPHPKKEPIIPPPPRDITVEVAQETNELLHDLDAADAEAEPPKPSVL